MSNLLLKLSFEYLISHFEKVSLVIWFFLFKDSNFLNVYLSLRERERQSMSRGGAERDRDTEPKAGSRLCAASTEPDVGLKLTSHEI